MKILSSYKIDLAKYGLTGYSYFIRVSPENFEVTIKEILLELSNFSWLAKINKDYLKVAMEHRANSTCEYLKTAFYDNQNTPLLTSAGEYIVSSLSKRSIVEELNHLDIPLAELLGRKKVGNPGFDFFTEDLDENQISCGEAKFENGKNAYNSTMKQIRNFIIDKKYCDDIPLLQALASENSLYKMSTDKIGVSAGFSSTNIMDDNLIEDIIANKYFRELVKKYKVILVAVNMYEEK